MFLLTAVVPTAGGIAERVLEKDGIAMQQQYGGVALSAIHV